MEEVLFGVCLDIFKTIYKCIGDRKNLAHDMGWNKTIPFLTCRTTSDVQEEYYADDVLKLIRKYLPPNVAEFAEKFYSDSYARTTEEVISNDKIPRTWMNPLESRLPYAPNMTIYCFHGIGKSTERAYSYKSIVDSNILDAVIDLDVDDKNLDLVKGVYRCEGDGTIPLISLGFMGIKGWRKYKSLNPSGSRVIVREYKDDPSSLRVTDVRGGPKSGDHVDILGNHELTMDILKIVTNFRASCSEADQPCLNDRILSNLPDICDKINLSI